MHKYRTYLIFGAPGAGKGTQGKALGSIPRFFHCACGDVFRGIDTRTPLGRKFVEYSSRGELVPDEFTVQLWVSHIEACKADARFKADIDALVLDGIPRNVHQAELMREHIDVRRVFHLSCPDRSKLVERLRKRAIKDNRLDDASETVIRHRLETYEHESKPMLEYYGEGLIRHIDAAAPPVIVFSKIIAEVAEDVERDLARAAA
jgi:adenylate kinase